MSSHVLSRGSRQQVLWRVAMLLALLAVIFTTGTSQAAPPAQVNPCNQPGVATIIDPAGGTVQVRMYSGTNPANSENYDTSIQKIVLSGGQVVYGYCIDSIEARLTGITVCLLSEISNARLAYLIAKYPPDTQNRINQAARQAAVWHFSNGISLDQANATTGDKALDDAVVSAYNTLVAEITAFDPTKPPAMTVSPPTAINQLPVQAAHLMTLTLTAGGLPQAGIQVQVASNFGSFDHTTATTDAKGQAKFTISSSVPGTANITATAVVTVPKSLEYVVQQDPTGVQPFGIPSSTTQTLTATASKEWRTDVTLTPTPTPTNTPTATSTPTTTPTPIVTITSTPTFTPTSTPAQPGSITLTKVVTLTKENSWAFAFQLTTLDGGNPQTRVVSKAEPMTAWNNLTPGVTYYLSEQEPGAPWVEGNFICTLDDQPVGVAEPNGPITLPVNPGDNIVCLKYNVDMSGTDLSESEEPPGLGKRLFMPMLNR